MLAEPDPDARPIGPSTARRQNWIGPLLVIAGLLVILGGVALWLWLGRDDGPNFEADCRVIEKESPKLRDELPLLMDPGADPNLRLEAARSAADHFDEIAAQLSEDGIRAEMAEAAAAMHRAADAYEERDLDTAVQELNTMIEFYNTFYAFVDKHCDRWISPGQWDKPGTKPTGPSLPTKLPPIPEIPELPARGLGAE